ncbi:signal transduction histidine kinase [Nocardioides sp. J9]|nr:signal transduction histidine kinase [Nocardioides sp. J9]
MTGQWDGRVKTYVGHGVGHRMRSRQQGTHHRGEQKTLGWALLLTALMLHPYAILALEGTGDDPVTLAGNVCTVVADLILIGCALVLALDARTARCAMRANLATIAMLVAVQDLPLVVMAVADPDLSGHAFRLTGGHVLTVAAVLALVVTGSQRGRPPRRNPLVAGLLLGGLLLAIRMAEVLLDPVPYLHLGSVVDVLLMLLLCVLGALVCVAMMRSPLPRQASAQITIGVLSLVLARLTASVMEAATPPPAMIVGVLLSSAILATTSISLLLGTLSHREAREHDLQHRAAVAEATVRHDREVVHEVRSATAGIVAGVHLLANDKVPPGPRRKALQRMVDVEASRLDRRMSRARAEETIELELDELVEPLVVAHAAQGHDVVWWPSGNRVVGRHDAVVEVISILLANAARHAGGVGTAIDAQLVGDQVHVCVSDGGPGIADDVRDRVFEWGARTATSVGEGVGLHCAHRLAREMGGDLRLDDSRSPKEGACFVLVLPAAATAVAPRPASLHAPAGMTG